jgi:hypothetical protein
VTGCSGGGSSSSAASSGTHTTTGAQPNQKAVTARPGTTLTVGDISVKMNRMTWQAHAGVDHPIPGTRIYAVVSLRVTNNGTSAGVITAPQFWLLDALHREYLATAKDTVPNPLIGKKVAPGTSVNGTLVFGTPRKLAGGFVLAYQFKDATSIADAKLVGLLAFK